MEASLYQELSLALGLLETACVLAKSLETNTSCCRIGKI